MQKKSKKQKQIWCKWKYRGYDHSNTRDFNDKKYKEWRKNVYKRDRFKCQWPKCTFQDKHIYAHHIKTWANYPAKRFDINNGITLCKYHHNKIQGEEEHYARMFLDILLRKLKKD